MSLLGALWGRKKPEVVFDPNPSELDTMPVRPYKVLQANLPFYSDPECRMEVTGARLVVLRCDDPRQKMRTIECMPVRKTYRKGQWVRWDINHKTQWESAWYRNPETGQIERAWVLAVEFVGPVVSERAVAESELG